MTKKREILCLMNQQVMDITTSIVQEEALIHLVKEHMTHFRLKLDLLVTDQSSVDEEPQLASINQRSRSAAQITKMTI